MPAALHDLIEDAAVKLPEGWRIVVWVEVAAGGVTLVNHHECEIDFPSNHEGIDESFSDALEFAVANPGHCVAECEICAGLMTEQQLETIKEKRSC